jgi:hypothetical protein
MLQCPVVWDWKVLRNIIFEQGVWKQSIVKVEGLGRKTSAG